MHPNVRSLRDESRAYRKRDWCGLVFSGRTASRSRKIAVLPPMLRARVRTTTRVKLQGSRKSSEILHFTSAECRVETRKVRISPRDQLLAAIDVVRRAC